ncbi:hypothetical protein KY330_06120 [Candidatus Woesearchaeota archaeon]|nr:hypothetical protein [Candidatus Woesearchaeota archaeon]
MDKLQWEYLVNGRRKKDIKKLTPHEIQFEAEIKDLEKVIEAALLLRPNRSIIIPESSLIYPQFYDGKTKEWKHPIDPEDNFKKSGRVMNILRAGREYKLKTVDKETGTIAPADMHKHRLGPQTLMKLRADDYMVDDNGKRRSLSDYNWNRYIACYGWFFKDGKEKKIMPQDDLHIGWRLASVIISNNIYFKYSNPGGKFWMDLPSLENGPSSPTSITIRHGLMTSGNLWNDYTSWPEIKVKLTRKDGKLDIYRNYTHINHQWVAAIVLRNHVNDSRRDKRGFPPRENHRIKPVLLNVTPPPDRMSIGFGLYLDNNVLVKRVDEGGKEYLDKMLEPERELLWSMHLWYRRFSSCYRIDETLSTLDKVVEDFSRCYKKLELV